LCLSESPPETTMNISAYYVSDTENLVVVELTWLDENKIKEFQDSFFASSKIVFRQGEANEFAATIRPGQQVRSVIGNFNSSMGYRARRNGVNGFVMSGHSCFSIDEISSGNANLGHVVLHSFGTSHRSIDGAWVQLRAGNDASNTIFQNGFNLNTQTATMAVGTSVAFAGHVLGIREGTVNAIGINANIAGNQLHLNGASLTNQARASFSPLSGDSGGVVYRVISTNDRRVVGVVVSQNGIFSMRPIIDSGFGISMY